MQAGLHRLLLALAPRLREELNDDLPAFTVSFSGDTAEGLARLVPRAGWRYASHRNPDTGPERRGDTSMLYRYLRRRMVSERVVIAAVLWARRRSIRFSLNSVVAHRPSATFACVRFQTATAAPTTLSYPMPYYLQLRSSDGRITKDSEPYDNRAEAARDALFGARQIVGDAIKSGISLRAATSGRAFEIVDEAGTVITSLPFLNLVGVDGNS